MARLAKSLEVLRAQVNRDHPGRSKESDGWIGDQAHSSRTSDHNPNKRGVVQAIDVTHDPQGGFDSYEVAEALRLSGDPRIKYIISHGQICNAGKPWRPYNGVNAHNHHVHVSVKDDPALYDDEREWTYEPKPDHRRFPSAVSHPVAEGPTLRRGAQNKSVAELQKLLGITADGDFGDDTRAAVIKFQKSRGVLADGVVGPQTWALLKEKK